MDYIAGLCLVTLVSTAPATDQAKTEPITVSAEKLAEDFEHDPMAAKAKYQHGVTVSGKVSKEYRRFVRIDPDSKVKVWIGLGRFAENPKKRIGTELTATGTIINFKDGELWIDAKSVTPKGP